MRANLVEITEKQKIPEQLNIWQRWYRIKLVEI